MFENIAKSENAELQMTESTWFNGHAYFPLFIYNLEYDFLSAKVQIQYEFRQSEFSKSSVIDGGAFVDRHLYDIKCSIKSSKTYPNFRIVERGMLAQLFRRKSEILYDVKCKSETLQSVLKQNKNLQEIFKVVENSSEFSPWIEAKMKNGNYQLNIMFNTQQKNEVALNLINDFCKNLIEYFSR